MYAMPRKPPIKKDVRVSLGSGTGDDVRTIFGIDYSNYSSLSLRVVSLRFFAKRGCRYHIYSIAPVGLRDLTL